MIGTDIGEGPFLSVCEIDMDGLVMNSTVFQWKYVRWNNRHCIYPFHPSPAPNLRPPRTVGVVLELKMFFVGTKRVFLTEGFCGGNSTVKSLPINITSRYSETPKCGHLWDLEKVS